jgi:hypothetical protein
MTGEFGVGILTGITNGNGITTANNDKKIITTLMTSRVSMEELISVTAIKELESMVTLIRSECLKHLK